MTAWNVEGIADWDELQSRADTMWQKPSWAKGVLVDNASSKPGSRELFRAVQVASLFVWRCQYHDELHIGYDRGICTKL